MNSVPSPARTTVSGSGLSALVFLALATGCGSGSLPGPAAQPVDTLRVLTYNIHHGEGMDGVVDLERIAAFIKGFDPDMVTLQEVDSVVDRTGDVDQAEVLADLTGMSAAFGRFMPYQGGAYGMAVLSRWPILEASNLRLTDGTEPRTALAVRVRGPGAGQELVVVGIHFYETAAQRLAQARDLEGILEGEESPTMLSGDFNSTPDSEVMGYLGARWQVLDKGVDRLTFSSFDPVREIDFVLVRPRDHFLIREHRVLDEPVLSDHRALLTEVILRPQG